MYAFFSKNLFTTEASKDISMWLRVQGQFDKEVLQFAEGKMEY